MEKKADTKIALPVLAGLFIGAFLKFFVLDIVHVSGNSMQPTIRNGEMLIVNKLAYGIDKPFGDSLLVCWGEPKVGDIVVFMRSGNMVVKRVAATEGTTLEYSALSGYNLVLNGERVPLTAEQFYRMKDSSFVNEGSVLVLGDNTEVSVDSRSYGFVPINNILGKVVFK